MPGPAAPARQGATGFAGLTRDIHALAGREFNIASPQQLGRVLFEELKLPAPVKYGKGKTISTAVDVLEGLAEEHEIVRKVLEFRQLTKLKGTYVDALPALIDPDTGRIHTSFNQTGAATQTVSYCYDELHRVTGRGYGAQSCPLASPVVTYAYDSGANAKGHLTSMTDQAGTATYGYDILGRLTTETRTLIGANNATISKNISYTYNLDGSVKTLTYPSNNVITYTPDSAGRMLSAIDSAHEHESNRTACGLTNRR